MPLMGLSRVQVLSAVGVALLGSACEVFLNADGVQCSVDGDCAARGGRFVGTACVDNVCQAPHVVPPHVEAGVDAAPAGPLDCVGSPSVPTDVTKRLRLELPIINFDMGKPLTGATIKLCSRTDFTCATPRVTGLVPDPNTGVVVVNVEGGFSGYFQATGDGVQNSIYLVNPPAVTDGRLVQWNVISPLTFQTLAKIATNGSSAIDPQLGHAIVGARDCFLTSLAGASFLPDRLDSKTKSFYLVDNLPDVSRGATDKGGTGGFINLPTGFLEIRMTLDPGKTIATANIVIRPGFLTYILTTPAHSPVIP